MRFGPITCVAALAGCLAASGLVGAAGAASGSASSQVTSVLSEGPSGGMYGELAGSPSLTVPQLRIGPTQQASASAASGDDTANYSSGNMVCGVYASGSGMGSYCSTGTGVPQPLIERFPGMDFENCRFENPPPGIDVPRNPSPDEKRWQLRTCLTNIDWLSWNGGTGRRIIMDLVLVDNDMDTTYEDTPLSDYLWNNMQTMYPVPMLRVEPKTYPVVGQEAYFTFDWLDPKERKPVSEGPYAGDPDGGPYVEHRNEGMTMRAQATEMTIDPNIEGVEPFSCDVEKLGYDHSKSPRAEDQPSDCMHIFTRGSAAADEISTAENYLAGDDEVFRPRIVVRWNVEYGEPGGAMQTLGDGYEMVLNQDLPVLDTQAVNRPLFDSSLD
ncbi:MAG: hypothetical protein ACRDO7_14470 [Nocardioidaceae bacterium]